MSSSFVDNDGGVGRLGAWGSGLPNKLFGAGGSAITPTLHAIEAAASRSTSPTSSIIASISEAALPDAVTEIAAPVESLSLVTGLESLETAISAEGVVRPAQTVRPLLRARDGRW